MSTRFSFLAKILLTTVLVILADNFFAAGAAGSTLGMIALLWTICAAIVRPEIWRDRRGVLCLAVAFAFGLALFDQPGPLALLLFWISLTAAVLSPRAPAVLEVSSWGQRLAFHGAVSAFGPLLDAGRLWRARRMGDGPTLLGLLGVLVLPLCGGAVFLTLFASANPLIEGVLRQLQLPPLDMARVMLWIVFAIIFWAAFRPRRLRRIIDFSPLKPRGFLFEAGAVSVSLSLLVFNLLFALQNGLDIAFLWSGARLPDGLTLAQYAHRGAYPLIATALLAGLFVLVFLKPGSATARIPGVRRLVVVWVIQNLFLVASSILRTLDYIDAYSMTRLRIAAIIWMGLVALGLVLICWRLLRDKSSAWLVWSNTLAAAAVLSAATVVDLGALAAAWNVRHAREVGGRGVNLDLAYMGQLGPAALIPLIQLERRPLPPGFAEQVAETRRDILVQTVKDQSDWRSWTWRDARRLARARALLPAGDGVAWSRQIIVWRASYKPAPPPPLTNRTRL